MISQDGILVQLLRLVDRIPTPPPPPPRRPRGRPVFYPERLFLKALLIMIVRRLHKVGELLAVLEEPTPEMRCVRAKRYFSAGSLAKLERKEEVTKQPQLMAG